MNDVKRIIGYLRKVPMFAMLENDVLARLVEVSRVTETRRREVVYLPGDPGTSMYVVATGRVKVSRVTRDGKSLTLSYIGESEIFGEACLEAGGPRTEMAEASESSLLIAIDRLQADQLIDNNPSVGASLLRLQLARRRELESKLEALIFRDVTSKLAELLLQLGEDHGVNDARGVLVSLKITHQELANLIGSTRETVSLTLSQFKRQRYILTDGRKVILADRDALRALY